MPIATRSRTGKLPQNVIQSVEVIKKPKKRENKKSKKINDENDAASSPSITNPNNYQFNSNSGETTYFSFEYRPLRRNHSNNISSLSYPKGEDLSSPVPFTLKQRNVQDMPGASMNGVIN